MSEEYPIAPEPLEAAVPPQIPMPVLPLGYPAPIGSRRPGIITAIGVMSIVIAALGMVGSIMGGLYAIGLTAISASMRSMATTTRYTASASVNIHPGTASPGSEPAAPADQLRAGPRGLDANKRKTIVDQLDAIRPMSNEQRERLTQLLAKA